MGQDGLASAADGSGICMGACSPRAEGEEVDLEAARALFTRAASAGMVEAKAALAEMMLNGQGEAPADSRQARGSCSKLPPQMATQARCSRDWPSFIPAATAFPERSISGAALVSR